MEYTSSYVAKQPDGNGLIAYTNEENFVWKELIERQLKIIEQRSCQEYLDGLTALNMAHDHIPQPHEMNTALSQTTGWSVEPVPALIPVDTFFKLLANKHFPAASFIRVREELDYLQEPDIFHEFFGHCPMLTDQSYADFMQQYGKIALAADEQTRHFLGRLYWFTIEFGLIQTQQGLKNYGGGILSSKEETIYAIESGIPERRLLGDAIDALRTPYRIDIKQPIYYVIESFEQLYELINNDILGKVEKAIALGEFEPTFPVVGKEKYHIC